MGGRAGGGATAQIRGLLRHPEQLGKPTATQTGHSQTLFVSRLPGRVMARGPKGSRARECAWGKETARAKAEEVEGAIRAVAVPGSCAAVAGLAKPGAAAQQPHLLFLRHSTKARVLVFPSLTVQGRVPWRGVKPEARMP